MKNIFLNRMLLILCFLSLPIPVLAQSGLERIHEKLIKKYDNVEHINGDDFLALDSQDLLIFDVRKESEFNVSHIEGSIRLDPNTSAEEFATQYESQLKGKMVVFYCSVGRRSSAMASRVEGVINEGEASASYNLTGGVFTWRNQERALVKDEKTPTAKVHPYNFYTGRLIKDRDAISYKPK